MGPAMPSSARAPKGALRRFARAPEGALRHSSAAVLASLVLLAGCESPTYGAPPALPPAPPPSPVAPAPAEPAALDQAAAEPAPSGKRAGKGKRARERERESSQPPSSEARKPAADPAPAPPPPAKPPAATPAAAPPTPKGSVRVPESEHVRIELPSGLQADLDHDPRMQPWVNKAVSSLERCYAPLRDAGAAGVIEVRLVMHENERPSAEPGKLPSSLTPMLACVTGDLMRVKMPLFTGKEGTRYTLKIRLAK
jgi:hypothetical protein